MYNLATLITICCSWFICAQAVLADAPNGQSFPADLAIKRNAIQQLTLGDAYAMSNDFEQAVQCYQNAVVLDPNRAELHFKLACAAWNERNVELASEHFLKTTQLDDHFADAYFGLAKCKERTKQMVEAIAALKECVRLKPSYSLGWLELGRAYDLVSDDGNAEKAYHMCLSSKEASAGQIDKANAALQRLKRKLNKKA